MSVTAGSADQAGRFDYDDFVRYTEMHPEGNFELLDGVIYEFAPEDKPHKVTRLKINTYLHRTVDLRRFTVGTEASFSGSRLERRPQAGQPRVARRITG